MTSVVAPTPAALRRAMTAGILLGVGFGGFVDGIVLHQILQWHHMLTSTGDHPATTVGGLEVNTVWDGLFHLLAWLAADLGVLVLGASLRAGGLALARRADPSR